MNIFITLLAHLLRNTAILFQPGGLKSIIAENPLLKQQLLVLNVINSTNTFSAQPLPDPDFYGMAVNTLSEYRQTCRFCLGT